MSLDFARVNDELGYILSGRVLMLAEAKRGEGQEQSDALANQLWFGREVPKFVRDMSWPMALELPLSLLKTTAGEKNTSRKVHQKPRQGPRWRGQANNYSSSRILT